ncbi:MAG: Ferrous iron transport protein B [Planctomycetes bacterium ADurb.Bin412]|nr:MAG: Ferrous iron transport protein B [Planctomycetes bacterium ADurb.Bin412]
MEKHKTFTVALCGNPNSGKTTLFNSLTGSHQRVGNYGGVTVETKEGICRYNNYRFRIVDLPGTYSLSAYSIEEIVTRDYLLHEKPDVVINVTDGTNLERNLYLTVQLRELAVPMVIALNMADEMDKRGLQVNLEVLSQDFGAPVVPTVGTRDLGMKELLDKVIEVGTGRWSGHDNPPIRYGDAIETELQKISQMIEDSRNSLPNGQAAGAKPATLIDSPKWLAIKLLENDQNIVQHLQQTHLWDSLSEQVQYSQKYLNSLFGEDPETIIAEQRYGFVRGVCRSVIRLTAEVRANYSDKIDLILTNRLLGLPIFAVMMYLTFWLVFTVGEYPMGWIESGIGHLAARLNEVWPAGQWQTLQSLLTDGVIAGVGGVIVFLPNIMLLFLALAMLEDTGYMARAAFIMDRMMKWVGLHGKSFIPMLTGFGCSVPGILGTRVLDNQRDRLTTMLVLPLMSCGARLTIYMLIIPAFFSGPRAALVMYAIYIIGILVAVICARLLRSTLFKGETSPFVLELPPYRIPTFKAVVLHMWQRSWAYLQKAGTIILLMSILMWALTSFPKPSADKLASLTSRQTAEYQLQHSFAGRIGRTIEPVLKPMGFDWKIGTALIGAFAAKELFVSQMGIVYSLAEENPDTDQAQDTTEPLRRQLKANYSPLTGFCIMLFCLIATPCMATVAVTRRESGKWSWAMFQFWGLTLIAWILTTLVFQLGSFLRLGTA